MKPSVVLVHVGEFFLEYINDCISQIKRFNNCDIYLVMSEQHRGKITKNVSFIAIETLQKSEQHLKFLENTQLDPNYRDGFWLAASERFFYINDVVKQYQLQHVFHFENDVMIYCDLDKVLSVCTQNNFQMAATFDNDNRCIPGFVYFQNGEILSKLNDFMLLYEKKNDMELIVLFNKKMGLVDFFPVVPPFYKFSLISRLKSKSLSEYSKNYTCFGSIFDAAAFGQYLGGIDPRNGGNTDTKNFINESALYNVSKFKISWEVDEMGRNIPFAYYGQEKIRINNLHIHSKNLQAFL